MEFSNEVNEFLLCYLVNNFVSFYLNPGPNSFVTGFLEACVLHGLCITQAAAVPTVISQDLLRNSKCVLFLHW